MNLYVNNVRKKDVRLHCLNSTTGQAVAQKLNVGLDICRSILESTHDPLNNAM